MIMADYVVRVSDGRNKIYYNRQKLYDLGFRFNKRAKEGESFYEKKCQENEAYAMEKFSKLNGLDCTLIPAEYTRSSDYRKEFFKIQKPVKEAVYRCAYCGRKYTYKDIQVDHIFPVNGLSYCNKTRQRAARYGIKNANDQKNLCCACKKCNSKKGTKLGSWVIRGFLGKKEWLWKIRIAARFIIAGAIMFFVIYLLKNQNSNVVSQSINMLVRYLKNM